MKPLSAAGTVLGRAFQAPKLKPAGPSTSNQAAVTLPRESEGAAVVQPQQEEHDSAAAALGAKGTAGSGLETREAPAGSKKAKMENNPLQNTQPTHGAKAAKTQPNRTQRVLPDAARHDQLFVSAPGPPPAPASQQTAEIEVAEPEHNVAGKRSRPLSRVGSKRASPGERTFKDADEILQFNRDLAAKAEALGNLLADPEDERRDKRRKQKEQPLNVAIKQCWQSKGASSYEEFLEKSNPSAEKELALNEEKPYKPFQLDMGPHPGDIGHQADDGAKEGEAADEDSIPSGKSAKGAAAKPSKAAGSAAGISAKRQRATSKASEAGPSKAVGTTEPEEQPSAAPGSDGSGPPSSKAQPSNIQAAAPEECPAGRRKSTVAVKSLMPGHRATGATGALQQAAPAGPRRGVRGTTPALPPADEDLELLPLGNATEPPGATAMATGRSRKSHLPKDVQFAAAVVAQPSKGPKGKVQAQPPVSSIAADTHSAFTSPAPGGCPASSGVPAPLPPASKRARDTGAADAKATAQQQAQQADVDSMRAELVSLKQDHKRLQTELAAQQRQLTSKDKELAQASSKLAAAERAKEEVLQKLEAAQKEVTRLKEEAKEANEQQKKGAKEIKQQQAGVAEDAQRMLERNAQIRALLDENDKGARKQLAQ